MLTVSSLGRLPTRGRMRWNRLIVSIILLLNFETGAKVVHSNWINAPSTGTRIQSSKIYAVVQAPDYEEGSHRLELLS